MINPATCSHNACFATSFSDAKCLLCGAEFTNRESGPRHPHYKPCAACGAKTCACGCGQCSECGRSNDE